MNMKLPLKPLDYAVMALSLAVTLCAGWAVYAAPQADVRVRIQGPGGAWVFPLDAEERVAVAGPLGETVVEIHEGRARVLSSPCENQTCVAAGHIRRRGNWAACLPNRVIVSIEGRDGSDGEGPDAAAW
jgi:hypothetical protein